MNRLRAEPESKAALLRPSGGKIAAVRRHGHVPEPLLLYVAKLLFDTDLDYRFSRRIQRIFNRPKFLTRPSLLPEIPVPILQLDDLDPGSLQWLAKQIVCTHLDRRILSGKIVCAVGSRGPRVPRQQRT